MDKTLFIDKQEIEDESLKQELESICSDLQERGYSPIKQIAGYIISGDPGYISSFKECRSRIKKFDRTHLVEKLLSEFTKKWNT